MNQIKPKAGDILACSRNSIIAKLILFFLRIRKKKTRFSHIAQAVDVWGELYVNDGQLNGVNPRPFDEWMKEFNYTYEIIRPKDNYFRSKIFFIKAFSKVGKTKYDLASLLWYHPIYILFGKWYGKKNKKAEDKMTCSEYVAWLHGIEDYYKLSPQDVFEVMDESNEYEIIQ